MFKVYVKLVIFLSCKSFFTITFSFTKKPKKYALIKNEQNPERMLKHQKKLLKKFDLEECAKSNLPDNLRTFMETVVSWPRERFGSNFLQLTL